MKKIFLILAMMLVAALVVACGGGDDGGNEQAPTPENVATPGGDTAETPEAPPAARGGIHEPRDLGGRIIRLGNWWDSFSTYIFEEPDPAEAEDFEAAMLIWENAQRIRADWNVEFEHVNITYAEMVPRLTANAATGVSDVDIVHLSGHMVFSAVTGGLIHPLGSIAPATSDTLGASVHNAPGIFHDNNYWTFNPHMYDAGGFGLGVNMDLIRQLGLPNPMDYYAAGNWTWDIFLEIMRRAGEVPGHFGLAGNHGEIALCLIASNDGMLVDEDNNFGLGHPNTIAALELLETIFRERLWYYNPVVGQEQGDWGRNFWSFQDGNSVFWPAQTWSSEDIDFDYHVITFPLGPANTTGSTWLTGWPGGLGIPIGVEDPEAVFMIFEELHAWPGPGGTHRHFEDSVNWPMGVFRHEDDVWRMLRDVGESGRLDMGLMVRVGGIAFSGVMGDIISDLFNAYATPSEAVEIHRGERQAMLDQFFRE